MPGSGMPEIIAAQQLEGTVAGVYAARGANFSTEPVVPLVLTFARRADAAERGS